MTAGGSVRKAGMRLAPLPRTILEPVVRSALAEDLGEAGDITSAALLPRDRESEATLRTRNAGIAAGTEAARLAFSLVTPSLQVEVERGDGSLLEEGDALLLVRGPATAILAAERTALNLAQRMSGIATGTRRIVDAIAHTPTRVLCTRKTTPGLRALEKHAVRAGGGANHRFGLHDGYLIKDNHIAALSGDLAMALRRARDAAGPMRCIQIEVDTLEQLAVVLRFETARRGTAGQHGLRNAARSGPDGARSGSSSKRRAVSNRDNAAEIAETGVDFISSGWITHSAPALNLGLDFL